MNKSPAPAPRPKAPNKRLLDLVSRLSKVGSGDCSRV